MKNLKVAILGTANGWNRAPFADKSWEIWACNKFALGLDRCERIFEIHRRWNEDDMDSPDGEYLADLKKVEHPQKVYSIVPIGGKQNVILDREAMFKRYGTTWFSSSFGYMLALALDEKASEIGFWGVDMESREEYVVQLAGVMHFIDLARALGVKVTIPDWSLLNRKAVPYPDRFETTIALTLETKVARADKNVRRARKNLDNATRAYYETSGRYRETHDTEREKKLIKQLDTDQQLMEEWKDAYGRAKGELWALQQIRRLFVFNVIDPDIGNESEIDAENSGPT